MPPRHQARLAIREGNAVTDVCRMLSTSGILGYGFPKSSLDLGMTHGIHMLGVDGGSTDLVPHNLGSGKTLNSHLAMRRDLRLTLRAARRAGIPMRTGGRQCLGEG